MTNYAIKTIQDTFFKQRLILSEACPDSEKHLIEAGKELPIRS